MKTAVAGTVITVLRSSGLVLLLLASGCASKPVAVDRSEQAYRTARPSAVVVSVNLNGSGESPTSGPRIINDELRQFAALLADDVGRRLRAQRVPIIRSDTGQLPSGAILLELGIGTLDSGSRWKRMVVGFGMGRSQLEVIAALRAKQDAAPPLLSFQVKAGSGYEPGAAMALLGTAGGSLLVPALQGGVSAYRLNGLGMDKDLEGAAQAVLARLDQYFRLAGWTEWTATSSSALGGNRQAFTCPVPRDKPR